MTVPLDLLVRVRVPSREYVDYHIKWLRAQCDTTCDAAAQMLAELTAQIEQQQGQGEPVAWQYFDAGQWWPTSSIDKYPPNIPTRALYATPQDSVPAWAIKEAFLDWRLYREPKTVAEDYDWIWSRAEQRVAESRALALAQTKEGNSK